MCFFKSGLGLGWGGRTCMCVPCVCVRVCVGVCVCVWYACVLACVCVGVRMPPEPLHLSFHTPPLRPPSFCTMRPWLMRRTGCVSVAWCRELENELNVLSDSYDLLVAQNPSVPQIFFAVASYADNQAVFKSVRAIGALCVCVQERTVCVQERACHWGSVCVEGDAGRRFLFCSPSLGGAFGAPCLHPVVSIGSKY